MQLEKLPTGPKVPDELYVVIEIPAYGPGIKFEFEKASGALLVDRFLATPMHYPCNYGFLPHTLSNDGDPLDALVITPIPLIPGTVIASRPIGVLETEDDAGGDQKSAGKREGGKPWFPSVNRPSLNARLAGCVPTHRSFLRRHFAVAVMLEQ